MVSAGLYGSHYKVIRNEISTYYRTLSTPGPSELADICHCVQKSRAIFLCMDNFVLTQGGLLTPCFFLVIGDTRQSNFSFMLEATSCVSLTTGCIISLLEVAVPEFS